jgi:hypothetical protein
MNLNDPRLTSLAFRALPVIREVVRELVKEGHGEDDVVHAVANRVQQIQAGLSPELEFIAAANWLGKIHAINRIDQIPLPQTAEKTERVYVPDILCIATTHAGNQPFLIEVKTTAGPPSTKLKLVWTEKYITSLRRYSEVLQMPLLLAWKAGHIWTLVDVTHFKKKVTSYHLDWGTALRENLMHLLFGDQLIQLTDRVSFFLDANVEGETLPQPPALMPEGLRSMRLTGAGFSVDGNSMELSNELSWVVIHAATNSEVNVTGPHSVRISNTAEPNTIFSLTDFALMLFLWDEKDVPDWENVVRRPASIAAQKVREELEKGFQLGVVQYILNQRPNTIPPFHPAPQQQKD